MQDLEGEHREKKAAYESLVAGYESNRAQLEKEVKAMREERAAEESRFHYLNAVHLLTVRVPYRLEVLFSRTHHNSSPASEF